MTIANRRQGSSDTFTWLDSLWLASVLAATAASVAFAVEFVRSAGDRSVTATSQWLGVAVLVGSMAVLEWFRHRTPNLAQERT